jgi:hypothetical protein
MSRKYLGSYCAERDFVYNGRKLMDGKALWCHQHHGASAMRSSGFHRALQSSSIWHIERSSRLKGSTLTGRIMKRRLSIACGALLLSAIATAETKEAAVGPYCWAGTDDNGKAVFIPCHRSERHGIKDADLDLASLSRLRIHISAETITVSPEQLSKALAGWREENRTKP